MSAIYGLLGYPVKHSLSPAMHNAAFRALGIDAQYMLFEVKPEDLGAFLRGLDSSTHAPALSGGICSGCRPEGAKESDAPGLPGGLHARDISGMNVTVPYKEKVLDFVTLDASAAYLRHLRAVNTIVKKSGVWTGYNTDVAGFGRHLKEQFDPCGRGAAILGAGGAARAAAYVLAKEKAADVAVFDTDRGKSLGVARMVRDIFPSFPISAADTSEALRIRERDLFINATPLGLHASDPLPVDEKYMHKELFVYDLIYNPARTKLLSAAAAAGARTSNGAGMLLYQAAAAFEYFTGQTAPLDVMRAALTEAMKAI